MSNKGIFTIFVILLTISSTFGQVVAVNGTNTTKEEIVEKATVLQGNVSQLEKEPNITQEPLQLATKMEGKPVYDAKIESKKPTFKVKLRSGEFTPQRGMQSELRAMATEALTKIPMEKTPATEPVYVLMQFNEDTLSKADFEAMQSGGVSFLDYLPEDTYVAKTPLNRVQSVTSYASVRWIGILKPEQKISPELKESLNGSEPIKVVLSFYEDLGTEDLETIKNLSTNVYGDSAGDKSPLIIEAVPDNIIEIAKLNPVKWIYPWYPDVPFLDASKKVVTADYVWSAGNDATGVTVGIIDSGIQHAHDHFDEITIYDAYDWVEDDGDPNNRDMFPEAVCGEASCSDWVDNDGDGRVDEGTRNAGLQEVRI